MTIQLLITLGLLVNLLMPQTQPGKTPICHAGWIDLNKNRRMDVYEILDIERRVNDPLSQMTLEEKTCQTAHTYDYKQQGLNSMKPQSR